MESPINFPTVAEVNLPGTIAAAAGALEGVGPAVVSAAIRQIRSGPGSRGQPGREVPTRLSWPSSTPAETSGLSEYWCLSSKAFNNLDQAISSGPGHCGQAGR